MKKVVSILLGFALMFVFVACNNGANHEGASTPTPQRNETTPTPAEELGSKAPASPTPHPDPTVANVKALVVYFSWSGNTKNVAEAIQAQTHADILEIVPVVPYSDDYDTVLEMVREEQRVDARPAIANNIANMEEYGVIYVGYPIWWGNMPMILHTFFESYDMSGKTIAPFCTSGGSGLSNTVNMIKELAPNATVIEGLHIGSSSVSNSEQAVSDWLAKNNIQ